MTAPGIDSCSRVPLYVEAYFRDQKLGSATAFPWLGLDLKLSLITNWHVVSGRNHETGQCTNKMGGIPDHLRVHVPLHDLSLPPTIIKIPTIDADGKPLWTEHPDHGCGVDVVSLEADLPAPPGASIMPMNVITTVPLKQRIGMPLFILGFPFGRMGIGMPVWKQATIASAPFLAPRFERYLIVDTASRPGMSGSPVIQRQHGEVEFEDGRHGRIKNGEGACNFIGVYSGRFQTNDPLDAQLGRVWPAVLVEQIVEHALRRS